MARNKGQRGEREVLGMLQPIVDEECERAGVGRVELKRNLFQTLEGGCDIAGLDWMSLEVKRVENASGIGSWWAQTLRQAGTGKDGRSERVPVLLHRQNNQPWKCRMRVPIGGLGGPTVLVWFRYKVRCELSS
jgi:hypothetical protein